MTAAPTPSATPDVTDPTAEALRWGLVGYGSGGRTFHRPLLLSASDLQLVAVTTTSAQRRAEVAQDAPAATTVDGLDALPGLGVVGVTITTPSGTHVPLAHQALDLGLHVVLDKPFALNAPDARGLVEHAAAVGRVIVPYQNRRWDSDYLTVQALLAAGTLGDVHTFTNRIERFRPLKDSWHGSSIAEGGGTLVDLGPHLVDQALSLFGRAATVHAELRTLRPGAGAEDDIELHITHESGVRTTVAAGMVSATQGARMQVNGTRAGYVVGGFDIQEEQLKNGGSPASLGDAWGTEPESAWGTLAQGSQGEDLRAWPSERGRWDTFYPAVAAAIRDGSAPPVPATDAVHTAEVLDAARVSSAERVVVSL
ncbi:Gfo/Idh/MocA family oxidoreductase [Nakamurella flavida]|uniref:Gfo/Idh/MocA family oxidoreductase n=1 Tax=Nakamurella flavida TaxID=363630 RepID=A0A938YHX5_9ACTN|nr:Gfo/Idh/MocA family oxidoreductase [Nakamurella flavida]MBM9475419.1 Gfo/Idh/MocA family oxidoreductase [Nakamurella flavida]MBM9475493.1 Gfo/Idh/MocA family oxidoreductase [Nakamurella flavida]MDP9776999.1 putative dehydrogenase [Nakamurella flavida]